MLRTLPVQEPQELLCMKWNARGHPCTP
jgi:hypothetical protein